MLENACFQRNSKSVAATNIVAARIRKNISLVELTQVFVRKSKSFSHNACQKTQLLIPDKRNIINNLVAFAARQ